MLSLSTTKRIEVAAPSISTIVHTGSYDVTISILVSILATPLVQSPAPTDTGITGKIFDSSYFGRTPQSSFIVSMIMRRLEVPMADWTKLKVHVNPKTLRFFRKNMVYKGYG